MGDSEPPQQWDNLCGRNWNVMWMPGWEGIWGRTVVVVWSLSRVWLLWTYACTAGSSVHGISHARIVEWVFISFSRRSSQLRNQTHFSCIACEFFTPKPPGFLLGENGYMYMDGWVPLLSTWDCNNTVNWLCVCMCVSCLVVSDSSWPHGLLPARLLCPWDSPGKNTGVGCHALLQEVFFIQGLNPALLHWRWILYRLSHQGRHINRLQSSVK